MQSLLKRIGMPLWLAISVIVMVIAYLGTFLGFPAAKTAVYTGILFLIATLVPVHFKKFARYRRDS